MFPVVAKYTEEIMPVNITILQTCYA